MAIVTQTGPLRSLAVIAACLVGGIVGAILHGALYEKHGWFSGFGFAFGAVAFGLVASVVVDFGMPLLGVVWTGTAPPPPGVPAGAQQPAQPTYPAAVFTLQLLIAFIGAVAAAFLLWGILQLVQIFAPVTPALGLGLGILAVLAGTIAGWRAGLGLARALDLTVE